MVASKARWCHSVAWVNNDLVAMVSATQFDPKDQWQNVGIYRLPRTDLRRAAAHLGFSGAANRTDSEMRAEIIGYAMDFRPSDPTATVRIPSRRTVGWTTPTPKVSEPTVIEPTPSVSEPTAPTTSVASGSVESAMEILIRTIVRDEVASSAKPTLDISEIGDIVTAKVNELVRRPVVTNVTVNHVPVVSNSTERYHKQYGMLFQHLMAGDDAYIFGGPGCSKSETARQVARDWGREFLPISFSSQSTEAKLVGFRDASGNVVATPLADTITRPSVVFFDEFDACPGPIQLVLNAMVANRFLPTPSGVVEVHPDAVFLFAGNTTMDGATAQMTGRSASDLAMKDRLSFIEWELDEELETGITHDILGDASLADTWLTIVRTCRRNVANMGTTGARYQVTPRASYKGAKLLAGGFDLRHVANVRIRKGADARVWAQMTEGVTALI